MSAAQSVVEVEHFKPLISKKNFNALPYLLLLPTMLFLIVFTFYPFIRSIFLTFYATDSIGRAGSFVGLRIWKKVLLSDEFKRSLIQPSSYAGSIGRERFSLGVDPFIVSTKVVSGSKIYQTISPCRWRSPRTIAASPRTSSQVRHLQCNDGLQYRMALRCDTLPHRRLDRDLGQQWVKLHLSLGRVQKCP